MEQFYRALKACDLFSGIGEDDIPAMLSCLGAGVREYKEGAVILGEGDPAGEIGVVLSGAVCVARTDLFGNRSVISKIGPLQMFGEALACSGADVMPVDVTAAEDTRLLFIDAGRITRTCGSACEFHSRMIANLLRVVALKNLAMNRKLEITSKRSTREKLLAYLAAEAKRCGSDSFTIPFDRQELADYLEVDRSGLSSEIGKLRREGVIECRRSDFRLLRR